MALLERLSLRFGKQLSVMLQTEAAECGLACLAMIADYHGYRTDLPALRRRFPVSLRGSRLSTLVDIANRLQLATRAVRVELEDMHQLRLPCILHWNFQHFVVLQAVGAKSLTLVDPSKGLRTVSLSEVSKCFTGVALELWKNPGFEAKVDKQEVRLGDLIGHVTGLSKSLGQVLLLALTLEVFAIVGPFYMQWVIDNVLLSNDRDLLSTLAFGFLILVVMQQVIGFIRAWVLIYMGTTLNVQWRANVFTHMLRLPGQYFEKRHIGDIVSRFSSIDTIQRTLTTSFIEGVLDGLMAAVTLVMIFIYSSTLAWICVSAMAMYALSRWAWYRPLRLATADQIVRAAKLQSHFLETIRGVKTVKLFQRYEERRSSWLTLLVEQINSDVQTQKLQLMFRMVNGLLFGIENVVVIWVGARLALDGALSAGMLIAFMSYRAQFSARIGALIDKAIQLKMLRLHGERLADIVLTDPEMSTYKDRLVISETGVLEPSIEVRGLKFRYAEHEPLVLSDVNIEIQAGESVAITGPSGCGKTTLINVMLGLLAPTEGDVLIGGTSIQTLGVDAVRDMVATVTQDDTLFEGTLADNISFFDAEVDQQWVEECAQRAAIHDDICEMPMGYNTFVGYLGLALSGGQKQRILLARALYKRPRILILDEATSHLDVQRELVVAAAVRALKVTRIVVAHRPQTIETTDRVIRLNRGRVVEVRTSVPRRTPGRDRGAVVDER
jgi:ATP-binding cassette, subfamily B, bacterial CvaB/MchF/RaxB